MNMTIHARAGALLAMLALFGCQSPGMYPYPASSMPPSGSNDYTQGTGSLGVPVNANGYGVVQAIEVVNRQDAGVGLGAVGGAIVGGLVGSQIGGGRGNTAATIAGAAGGALAGNAIEKQRTPQGQLYRVTLRLNDGSQPVYTLEYPPAYRVGDRVRVYNGVIERY